MERFPYRFPFFVIELALMKRFPLYFLKLITAHTIAHNRETKKPRRNNRKHLSVKNRFTFLLTPR